MAAAETGSEHMKRTLLSDRARETVERIAKKLEAWESNGEDMQIMEPEQSHALHPHLAELIDRCNVNRYHALSRGPLLTSRQIQDRSRYSFIRLKKERYFKISQGSLLLILLSAPDGTRAEISDQPFDFGEMVQVSEGVRISGPTVFLRLV